MQSLKRLNILRYICYAYFLLLCAFWLFDNGFPGFINWPVLIVALLILLQMLFRIRKADLVLGLILAILSSYMLLAVTSDLADHLNGTKPVSSFWGYFGFGFGVFGTAWAAAGGIIYVYYARRRLFQTV
jgi:hypothetical protein